MRCPARSPTSSTRSERELLGDRAAPSGRCGSGSSSSTSAGCASPARAARATAPSWSTVDEPRSTPRACSWPARWPCCASATTDRRRPCTTRSPRARPSSSPARSRPAATPEPTAGRSRRRRWTSPSSAWPACSPARRTSPTFWANILGGADAITEVPPDRWDAERLLRRGPRPSDRRSDVLEVGRLPAADPVRRRSRYGIPPAALAVDRAGAAARARSGPARAGATPATASRPFDRARTSRGLRRRGRQRPGHAPRRCARCCPPTWASCPPSSTSSCRGSPRTPSPACSPTSSPAGSPTGSTSAAPTTRSTRRAPRRWPRVDVGLQGAGRRHQRHGAVRRRRPAQRHQRLPAVLLGAARCRRPGAAARSTPTADGIALGEGVGVRRAQAARRRRARRRPDLRGDQGRRQRQRRPVARADRAAARRASAAALERAYRNAGVSPPPRSGWSRRTAPAPSSATAPSSPRSPRCSPRPGAAPGSCALGSVKSQIGHTKCAAGLAGLIKTALARAHRRAAADPDHLDAQPAPGTPASSPFVFHTEPGPWPRPPAERVAGVSAFGFGGTNFHAVLAGHADRGPAPGTRATTGPPSCSSFRGADRAAAVRQTQRLRTLLPTNDAAGRPWALRDLARTRRGVRAPLDGVPVRLAFVAGGPGRAAPGCVAAGDRRRARPGDGPASRQRRSADGQGGRRSSPGRAASAPACSPTCSSRSPSCAASWSSAGAGPTLHVPAHRLRRATETAAQRDRLARHPGRPAGAGHRRARRARPAAPGSAYGPTWSPGTATASWSRCARPARSTRPCSSS